MMLRVNERNTGMNLRLIKVHEFTVKFKLRMPVWPRDQNNRAFNEVVFRLMILPQYVPSLLPGSSWSCNMSLDCFVGFAIAENRSIAWRNIHAPTMMHDHSFFHTGSVPQQSPLAQSQHDHTSVGFALNGNRYPSGSLPFRPSSQIENKLSLIRNLKL